MFSNIINGFFHRKQQEAINLQYSRCENDDIDGCPIFVGASEIMYEMDSFHNAVHTGLLTDL
jgi:hypothetical protein